MANQDLKDLLNNMVFNTPGPQGVQDRKPPSERQVLINDPSLTSVNPLQSFGEKAIKTTIPLTNMGTTAEELVPYDSGTSNQNSESKKK